jgi:hypothetical protein
MARTQAEIEGIIEAAKGDEAALDGVTTTSRVSVWVGLKRVFASAQVRLEQLWDQKKIELDEAAAAAVAGTEKWYAQQVLLWQYGYPWVEIDGQLVYLIEDLEARLVTKVAVTTIGRIVYIKVAKDDGAEGLEPLSALERVSLESYIRAKKFAGTRHLLVSVVSDKVAITGNVYFDGKLVESEFAERFEAALDLHLKEIFFNGVLNKNRLRDAGEKVPGIIDFDLTLLRAKNDGGTYQTVTREYLPASGYFAIDELNLTYIPQ